MIFVLLYISLGNISTVITLILIKQIVQLSGDIPNEIADITNLEQFKIENNQVTGPIPSGLGNLQKLNWLRFSDNKMSGPIPESLANTKEHLYQLKLANNDFEGDLSMLSGHSFVDVSVHNNPKLCGMVPVGVRFAHGFNYYNTKLGVPCYLNVNDLQ